MYQVMRKSFFGCTSYGRFLCHVSAPAMVLVQANVDVHLQFASQVLLYLDYEFKSDRIFSRLLLDQLRLPPQFELQSHIGLFGRSVLKLSVDDYS